MRAHAAAHFEWEHLFQINFPDGKRCLLQSEYTGGDGRAYPVTIAGEIRGDFADLQTAQAELANLIGGDLLPPISIATNAAIETPMPVACFGVDLSEPRSFVGYSTPPANSWFPPGRRRIKIEPVGALIEAVGTQPDAATLRRANESFRHALLHWSPGERLLGGEFLFIAAETLSRFLLEKRAKDLDLNGRALARAEGFSKVDELRRQILIEIFGGEESILKELEAASSGFEHGYMATASVRERMEPVLEDALRSLREALIRASGVADDVVASLLCDDYAEPRPLIPPVFFMDGELSRTDESIPADEDLPWGSFDLVWKDLTPAATREGEDARFTFNPKIDFNDLPENVSLTAKGFGLRAGYVSPVTPPESPDSEASA